MQKPRVKLYSAKGIGVIVPWPSGVVYSNQAGGYSCQQPELEGIYVPLDDDFDDIEDKLIEYFTGPKHDGCGACNGLDPSDAERIDEILRARPAPPPIRVDTDRLAHSIEAWVYVRLRNEGTIAPLVSGFPEDIPAIMTWTNSD